MTSSIYNINEPFSFDDLTINPPVVTNGGNYFIKYSMAGKPLYIQPPECKSKGAISKNSKKPYCDLMFTNEHIQLIKWMEDLENRTCKLIYENRAEWFEGDMELSDIENYFASPMKIYKGGKFYLVRANIPSRLGKIHLKVYNENREEVSIDSIVENTNVITVLEIQGIKCSARSFQIEMEIKQLMTLEPVNLFDNCLINVKTPLNTQTQIEKNEVVEENPQHLEETEQLDDSIENIQLQEEKEENEDKEESLEQIESLEATEEPIPLEENSSEQENQNQQMESLEEVHLEVDTKPSNELDDLEFTVDLEKLDQESVVLKPHNDIYYDRYKEARKRALIAKNLALQAFLEAKEIKHKYNLDDIDSESDEEFFNQKMEEMNDQEYYEET
jgi:hypothetical protein